MACKCYVTAQQVAYQVNGKICSNQRQHPIQKHAGRRSISRKTALHLSDPKYLLTCDVLSCEGVVKTFQTFLSLRRNKDLRPVWDFPSSMLFYGTLSLFRTNFPRCDALLCFVTSSLANPIHVLTDWKCGVSGMERSLRDLPQTQKTPRKLKFAGGHGNYRPSSKK